MAVDVKFNSTKVSTRCAIILSCSFFCPSFIQASVMDELLDMPLEELVTLTIASSTLTDQTLRTAPSSITVFTHQQIQQLSINYLHELMNYVPGFQSFRQAESGDEYYHSSRGHRSSTSSREVLILIDGQRFHREFDNVVGAPMLPLGNIEKVEFIRGPGSAIYGSNAFTGVVSITTLKNINALSGSYGSNQNAQTGVLLSRFIESVQVDLYAQRYHDTGEAYPHLEDSVSHALYDSSDPRNGYDLNLKLKKENMQLNLLDFERYSNEFYVLGDSSNSYNETHNRYTSFQFQHDISWQANLETRYSVRHYEDSYRAKLVAPGLGVADVLQQEKVEELRVNNHWSVRQTQSVEFGLEYRHSHIEQTYVNSSLAGALLLYPATSRDIIGVYAQHQLQLSEQIGLTLGARYDDYSQIGSALSPRLGLVHQLSDSQTIKLLYGQAFRAPTTNELDLMNVGANLVGNSALNPEIIKTWELVWMNTWQQHSLTVSLFDNVITDAIIRDDSVTPKTFVNDNGEQSSQGVEIEYIMEFAVDWRLRGTYSYFNNMDSSDFRQSDQLASVALNYQRRRWNMNVSATYAGERETPVYGSSRLQHLKDYCLVNSKLQYLWRAESSVYVQVKNLLDEEYETPQQTGKVYNGVPNRGREMSVGMNWRF